MMTRQPLSFRKTVWTIIQSILWSGFIAALGVVTAILLIVQTDYVYWFDTALSNGHGPYQVSLIIAAIALVLYNITHIWIFVHQAFLAKKITLVDRLVLAITMWGLPWFAISLPNIDWGHLSHVVVLCQYLWKTSLAWIVFRIVFGICQILAHQLSDQKAWLLPDRPISANDEDSLGRSNIVRQIMSVIRAPIDEECFVVAITGEWGSGKTSVLNMVRNELKSDKSIISVAFNPWYFSVGDEQSLDVLLKRFFKTLEDIVNAHIFRPNIPSLISRYYKAISPALEKLPVSLDFLFEKDQIGLETIKKSLNTAFRELGRKIVVIIDDIDRMDGTEIAYLFKMVRLCADFDNFVYLLAYDFHFVNEQLKGKFGTRAQDYINKIVQLELPLPKVELAKFEAVFSHYLGLVEQQLEVPLSQETDFINRLQSIFNPYVIFLLGNIRLMKLVINRYLLVLPIVKGEINYFDLLVLEIIRLRFPAIYEQIYRNPKYFTYQNNINWTLSNSNAVQEVSIFFEDLAKGLDVETQTAILSLLGSVFHSVYSYHHRQNIIFGSDYDSKYREMKSAAHPDYFPRYFYLAVQQALIPDVVWDGFIKQIDMSTEDQTQQLINETLMRAIDTDNVEQWLGRMRLSIAKIDQLKIPVLLQVIARHANRFSDKDASFISLGEYQHMIVLVMNLLERLEPELAEETIIGMIDDCPDVHFLRELLCWSASDDGKNGLAKSRLAGIDLAKLTQLFSARLRRDYVQGDQNVLTETHHYGGLYALKDFLQPDEYRPYISRLLQQDRQNALLILRSLISFGHWFGELGGGTYPILEYDMLKSIAEPQQVLSIIESLGVIEKSDDENWAVEVLRKTIEDEKTGKTIERVSGRHRGRLE